MQGSHKVKQGFQGSNRTAKGQFRSNRASWDQIRSSRTSRDQFRSNRSSRDQIRSNTNSRSQSRSNGSYWGQRALRRPSRVRHEPKLNFQEPEKPESESFTGSKGFKVLRGSNVVINGSPAGLVRDSIMPSCLIWLQESVWNCAISSGR